MNDDDPSENFIDDGNIDYSNSTGFEVVEETKVSHGMFVSTRQVADTFFHQITPSQTVKVQLNPVTMLMENKQYSIENAETTLIALKNQGYSFSRKFNVMGKVKKPSKTIASALVFIFAFLLMLGDYLKEQVEDNWKPAASPEDVKIQATHEKIIWNNIEQENIWFVGIKSGKGFSVVLKKIGIFLTISLALCTMWANHII